MNSKLVKLISIFLLIVISAISLFPEPASAEPFTSYVLLTTLASCVGGPTVLVALLMASGALSAAGAAALLGCGIFSVPPPSIDPVTIGVYVIAGALVAGSSYWYYKKYIEPLKPDTIIISLNQALNNQKISKDSYTKTIQPVKDRLNSMLSSGNIGIDEYNRAISLIIQ
jgi:hypothetical protein